MESLIPIPAKIERSSQDKNLAAAATTVEQDEDNASSGCTPPENLTAEPAPRYATAQLPTDPSPISVGAGPVSDGKSHLAARPNVEANLPNASCPPTTVTLAINDLTIDSTLQCRVSANNGTVRGYMERMQAGDKFPPPTVFRTEDRFVLVDGRHRLSACSSLGRKTVDVIVREGARQDALQYALAANRDHGLPLNRADKRKAAGLAIQAFPDWSSRRLAELLKCSGPFIEKLRRDAGAPKEFRTGLDGRTRQCESTTDHVPADPITRDISGDRPNEETNLPKPTMDACERVEPAPVAETTTSPPEIIEAADDRRFSAFRDVAESLMKNWGISPLTTASWLRRLANEISPDV